MLVSQLCIWQGCVTQCCFVINRGGTGDFVEWRYFECSGSLLLTEIIFGWSWIIIFVEWNYFWLKFNKYFCWMKITWVEVEQILLLNETIMGWSWIIIFVEWYYFWLKLNNIFVEWNYFGLNLNKYYCSMKIIWVEVERKRELLNININCRILYLAEHKCKLLNFATFG